MRDEIKEIVNLTIHELKPNRMFETDHFIYWVKSYYREDGDSIDRKRFKELEKYVVENQKLPFNPELGVYDTRTYGEEKILRYSKTFKTLEYYNVEKKLRAVTTNSSNKILSLCKKKHFFKINERNYVKLGINRWLSLRNWQNLRVEDDLKRALLKLMLRRSWVDRLVVRYYEIPNKESRKAKSINDLVEICGMERIAKLVANVVGDLDGIAFINNVVDKNQIHKITNFLKQNREILEKVLKNKMDAYRNHRGFLVLFYYFLSRDNRCNPQILWDYLEMLAQENRKINLNISSYATIKRNHDELSREIVYNKNTGGEIKVSDEFPKLKSAAGINVELIEDVKRLDLESKILHHCVHSYKDRINEGACVIYSIEHAKERYTLQLSKEGADNIWWERDDDKEKKKDKEPKFYVQQLKGLYNCNPPIEMKSSLELFFKENNLPPVDKSYIILDNGLEKDEKKEEIEQKGVKILEDVLSGEIEDEAGPNRGYDQDLPF